MKMESIIRLRGIVVKLSRQLNGSASEEGLTPSQASALGLIAFRGPLGLAELASIEGLNPTMVSRIVGKLEDARLIRRVATAGDLRSVTVEVTEGGLEVNEMIRNGRARILSACVDRLDPADVEALVRALPALESLAEELKANPV
jgi:DNA-binding MarR family transcriptional regulator